MLIKLSLSTIFGVTQTKFFVHIHQLSNRKCFFARFFFSKQHNKFAIHSCIYICIGYLDRYRNMKLLQIQSSGDEFFLPDNEVKSLVKQLYDLFRYFL
jgi:hypothetical protein